LIAEMNTGVGVGAGDAQLEGDAPGGGANPNIGDKASAGDAGLVPTHGAAAVRVCVGDPSVVAVGV
jgi:hypothetical protein